MAREMLPEIAFDDCWTVPREKNGLEPVRKTRVEIDGTVRELESVRPRVLLLSRNLGLTEPQRRLVSAIRQPRGRMGRFQSAPEWDEKEERAKILANTRDAVFRIAGQTALEAIRRGREEAYGRELAELNELAQPESGLWLPFEHDAAQDKRVLALARIAGVQQDELLGGIAPVVSGKSGEPASIPWRMYIHYPYVEVAK